MFLGLVRLSSQSSSLAGSISKLQRSSCIRISLRNAHMGISQSTLRVAVPVCNYYVIMLSGVVLSGVAYLSLSLSLSPALCI